MSLNKRQGIELDLLEDALPMSLQNCLQFLTIHDIQTLCLMLDLKSRKKISLSETHYMN